MSSSLVPSISPTLSSQLSPLEKGALEPAALDPEEPIFFPEGGLRAWLAVGGALATTMVTFGFTNSWGVFQNYYQSVHLSNETPSSIAWIGSLQYCLIFLPSVIMGRLLDIGKHQVPFTIGCCTYVISIFLTAETHEYYQVLLCQGVLLGLSAGVLFGPALAILAHWFHKRRVLAYGVVACGSSIGGTVFPILVQNCIPKIGFKWTLRTCAFIVMALLIFTWFTLRPRLPPKRVAGGLFNFKAFKSPAFSLYVAGCFLIMMGLYSPLSYLDVMGTTYGLGSFSSYLISIANASSLIGRLGPGLVADKVGPINMLLPASTLAGIMMFAWPYCTSRGALIAFSVIYGIFCGSFVSLFAPGVAQLGDVSDIGRRMGVLTTCLAGAALVGPPISGAILTATGSYLCVAGFTGSVVLTGSAVLGLSRWFILGKAWGRV